MYEYEVIQNDPKLQAEGPALLTESAKSGSQEHLVP